jgi:hypothetical protein
VRVRLHANFQRRSRRARRKKLKCDSFRILRDLRAFRGDMVFTA